MTKIHGAPSFSLSNDQVSLHVTETGGHLAPVSFQLTERSVSPYALAPWQADELDSETPNLLRFLRGDFFCLPFGPQAKGPPHGEVANNKWALISEKNNELRLRLDANDVEASIEKRIHLRSTHTSIYFEHVVSNLDGQWSYGTHPILDLSKIPDGSAYLSVSPYRWASVYPELFSDPKDGAHQALKAGAIFTKLSEVPLAGSSKTYTDISRYPARQGADDLVMMVSDPASKAQPFAWSACVMDGYVWFSLKNQRDFPSTLFWLSNGGRSAEPWNGRHSARIGIEDVCSHFCDSVDVSRLDLLKDRNIPTTNTFDANTPKSLRHIHAVAELPSDFTNVASITPQGKGQVSIIDSDGTQVISSVDWEFVL